MAAPTAGFEVVGDTFYSQLEGFALIALLARAFSSGSAALTGVEAISNGVPAFREPKSRNAATTLGRIRAVLKAEEVGSGVGRNATMSGFYEGLAAGTHTVSVWARTANGNDSDSVMYDPGCWSSDVVNIKEYLPFGVVSLPAILRN